MLREISAFSDVLVVMLTAGDHAMDKVLELGADDYRFVAPLRAGRPG